jgi:uncharacterized protein CbrC (UPF0167 family)
MTATASPVLLQDLAERFAKAHAAFVDAVRSAIAENVTNPALANTPGFLGWQTNALPLLERQNATVQHAWVLFQIGETQTIPAVAAEQRHLAKQLDGRPMDFAGPALAQKLDRLETAVVVAASRLCSAAGIP